MRPDRHPQRRSDDRGSRWLNRTPCSATTTAGSRAAYGEPATDWAGLRSRPLPQGFRRALPEGANLRTGLYDGCTGRTTWRRHASRGCARRPGFRINGWARSAPGSPPVGLRAARPARRLCAAWSAPFRPTAYRHLSSRLSEGLGDWRDSARPNGFARAKRPTSASCMAIREPAGLPDQLGGACRTSDLQFPGGRPHARPAGRDVAGRRRSGREGGLSGALLRTRPQGGDGPESRLHTHRPGARLITETAEQRRQVDRRTAGAGGPEGGYRRTPGARPAAHRWLCLRRLPDCRHPTPAIIWCATSPASTLDQGWLGVGHLTSPSGERVHPVLPARPCNAAVPGPEAHAGRRHRPALRRAAARGASTIACVARGPTPLRRATVRRAQADSQDELGEFPLVGFFANGEISLDRLYGYTGVLALIL